MPDFLADLTQEELNKLVRRAQPSWVAPMKAVLTSEYFSDPRWIYELKFDGERCLAFKKGRRVSLMSRNKKQINASYPEVAEALEAQGGSFVVDGEVVAFEDGVPSFARLQRRMHVKDADRARRTGVEVSIYLFDILYASGYQMLDLPLTARKKVLKRALNFRDPLNLVQYRRKDGEIYLEEICGKPGWEGLIAKRGDSPYRQSRSKDWLKFKCVNEQELVIGGYTDPKGSREHFGALLVGYQEDGELRYAGKVGTGFDQQTLEWLSGLLRRKRRSTSPFADAPASATTHWVSPELVAQIGFSEWTRDGRLRHPRFIGLRRDKEAMEVVRERP